MGRVRKGCGEQRKDWVSKERMERVRKGWGE
jgi:hypothetical protein